MASAEEPEEDGQVAMADQQDRATEESIAASKLTVEERAKLVSHLTNVWRGASTCPFCNSANWDISGWAPISLGQGPAAVVLGGAVLPSVALVCMKCGYTVLINAMVAGLGRRVG